MLRNAKRDGTLAPATGEEGLTAREHQILHLIAEGESNKHIARELNIAEAGLTIC
jgi:DNA-binding NarL/FixJ family response regulator